MQNSTTAKPKYSYQSNKSADTKRTRTHTRRKNPIGKPTTKGASTNTETKESCRSCPDDECDGRIIKDPKTTESYCDECGLVVEKEQIDRGPEWRSFGSENPDDNKRVGQSVTFTMHDKGLSTTIGYGRDSYGNTLSAKKRKQIGRLRKWNNRSLTTDSKDRSSKKGLVEIKRMGAALGIADRVIETASMIYRRAVDGDLLLGRSIEGVATAALYTACRIEQLPQSYDEIERVSRVPERNIHRCYTHIKREMEMSVPPTHPKEYIPRFGSKIGIDSETRMIAEDIATQYVENGVTRGAAPTSLAAAAIYSATLVNDVDLTQDEMSAAINVSQPTIREFYDDMLETYDGVDLSEIGGAKANKADDIKEFIRHDTRVVVG